MKVVVFGASGKTGSLVVQKALAAGYEVTAFVRDDERHDARVHVVKGDATDVDAVGRALAGQEAVIDTIGGKTPWKTTDLEASSARAIIAGMKAQGVRRLVVTSSMGVGDSTEQTPFVYEYLLLPTMMRGMVKDKNAMEDAVEASGLDFVIVRPAPLSDDPETAASLAPPSAFPSGVRASDMALRA